MKGVGRRRTPLAAVQHKTHTTRPVLSSTCMNIFSSTSERTTRCADASRYGHAPSSASSLLRNQNPAGGRRCRVVPWCDRSPSARERARDESKTKGRRGGREAEKEEEGAGAGAAPGNLAMAGKTSTIAPRQTQHEEDRRGGRICFTEVGPRR